MSNLLKSIQSIPGKVFFWILMAGTIVVILLQFLGKATVLKAKEMNLQALINEAIRKFKIQTNDQKIDDLKKAPETKKDPKEVEDFYKKELK